MMLFTINSWFVTHYRTRRDEVGTFRTAQQLRKQGVPIEIALAILGVA